MVIKEELTLYRGDKHGNKWGKVKRGQEVKHLGVTIDEKLSWNKQYKTLNCKLKSGLSSLRQLKDTLPELKLDQVYRALFESHLRYGDEFWGSLSVRYKA